MSICRRHKRNVQTAMSIAVLVIAFGVCCGQVLAVKIGDITHLKGQRTNKLLGIGLVVGLKGTGDGGKYLPAIRPLAALMTQFANPILSLNELKDAKNVAIVAVEATLPEYGVREGDRIDVKVTSIGGAKSLIGGRLLITPLQGPNKADRRIYALASGPVHVPDTTTPTVGQITQGATLEADIIYHYVVDGKITLVLDDAHASWAMAHTIAQMISEETSEPGKVSQIARAVDPKNVLVTVPPAERKHPAAFIARIESLDLLMPPTEARVKINRRTKTIIITGDVEISPVAISHKGLTITTAAPAAAANVAVGTPQTKAEGFVGLDPQKQGGAKLADLLDALNQLKVPAEDRITIIEELHKTGKLHARLIVEE